MRLESVIVTDHAIQMWRKRVATYGDETVFDLAEVVKKATPIKKNDTLLRMEVGKNYRIDEERGTIFVLEPIDKGICRVVTVLNPDEYNNIPKPGICRGKKIRRTKEKGRTFLTKDNIIEQLELSIPTEIKVERRKNPRHLIKEYFNDAEV